MLITGFTLQLASPEENCALMLTIDFWSRSGFGARDQAALFIFFEQLIFIGAFARYRR